MKCSKCNTEAHDDDKFCGSCGTKIERETFNESEESNQDINRGSDLRYDLEISFEEAVWGTAQNICFPTLVTCDTCSGLGVKSNSSSDTCLVCHGQGRVKSSKTLLAKIPAGVDTGDRIRLSGAGETGKQGAPAGDFYIDIKVRRHVTFNRDGANLLCEMQIGSEIARTGGQIEVPTLDGKVLLKIPAGTQNEQVFRLQGKGVQPMRSKEIGDLLCTVKIDKKSVNLCPNCKSKENSVESKFCNTCGFNFFEREPKETGKTLSFFGAISKCFNKYFVFKGRASRAEYWWFQLFMFIVLCFLAMIMGDDFAVPEDDRILLFGLALVALLPNLALTTRRLHDINFSGWWQLIGISGIGGIILLCLLWKKSDITPNKYGVRE